MKVSELTGAALDWAVAKCEGLPVEKNRAGTLSFDAGLFPTFSDLEKGRWQIYRPTTDWAQGGPIIERQEIGIRRNAPCSQGREWEARPSSTAKGAGGRWGYGPTPLIAAMRCFVASELGEEIEVPEELKERSDEVRLVRAGR